MSTTPTTNLNLIKNNADEPIANWRTNDNTNMNTLDTAIKAVQNATDTLEKARQNLNNLIGVLGKNSSNVDLISKAQARSNLDVAQSGGAAKTLYADEQTIAQNASLIASLQDSVGALPRFQSNVSVFTIESDGHLGIKDTSGTWRYWTPDNTVWHSVIQTGISDCNVLSDTWYIADTSNETLNTPNKQGMTYRNSGLLISTSVSANFAAQLWIEKMDAGLFVRGKGDGTWSAWRKLGWHSVSKKIGFSGVSSSFLEYNTSVKVIGLASLCPDNVWRSLGIDFDKKQLNIYEAGQGIGSMTLKRTVITKTLTVNDYGNVDLGLYCTEHIVLFVRRTDKWDSNLVSFVNSNKWYAYAIRNVAGTTLSLEPSGTSITVEIYYIGR